MEINIKNAEIVLDFLQDNDFISWSEKNEISLTSLDNFMIDFKSNIDSYFKLKSKDLKDDEDECQYTAGCNQ
jgi:hypothetical protein